MSWMERHQVELYIAAMAFGVLLGSLLPKAAAGLEMSINPVLGLLLFATFLGVPLVQVGRAFRDLHFLGAALIVNFVVVPVVVFGLSRFVAGDRPLLIGVLLVLLMPCVDYVIVFTGLAGGARTRLLAAAPLLMLLQIVLLPLYLLLFGGQSIVSLVDPVPFIRAFIELIVIPLVLAAIAQWPSPCAAVARGIEATMQGLVVPLMMATLVVVIGSQIVAVRSQIGALLLVVPIYIAFLMIMPIIGAFAARIARLDIPATRALMFTGSTRNSLVVLPLALSLPAALALAPLVIVTQTLVELAGLVVFVRLIPRLVRERA